MTRPFPLPSQRTCLQLSSSPPASFTSSVRNIPSHTHTQVPAAATSLLPASNMHCASRLSGVCTEPTQVGFPPYTPHGKGSRDPCGHPQTQLSVLISRDLSAQGTRLASPSHLKHFPMASQDLPRLSASGRLLGHCSSAPRPLRAAPWLKLASSLHYTLPPPWQ